MNITIQWLGLSCYKLTCGDATLVLDPYTAFFASKSYMKENNDIIQRFTNAMAKAQTWVQETSAADIAKAISPQFPDSDVAVLTTVTQRHKDIDAWNATPVMKQEAFDRLQTVMENAGELDDRVPFAELVDNSFAEKAGK